MKNLWNWVTLTWDRILLMTLKQRLILIGSIILPAGSLILIFSQLGQLIIRRLGKAKTLKTSGKINITEEEIYKDLNWNGMRDFVKKEDIK
jgi:hypothetical protein